MTPRSRLPAFMVWALATALIFFMQWQIGSGAAQDSQEQERAAWAAMDTAVTGTAASLAQRLDERAEVARVMAHTLQGALRADTTPAEFAENVDRLLRETAKGAAPEVGAYLLPSPGVRYARRYAPDANGPKLVADDAVTYTNPDTTAWQLPMTNGEGWLTFSGSGDEQWFAQYAVPIYQPSPATDAVAIGIVFVRYAWKDVEALSRGLRLGQTGYAFVVTAADEVIGHPQANRTAAGLTLSKLAKSAHDLGLAEAGDRAHRGESGFLDRVDPQSQELERIEYQPVGTTGWSLMAVAGHREAVADGADTTRAALHVNLCRLLGGYTAFSAIVTVLRLAPASVLWMHSVAWSLMMMLGTATFWHSARGQVDDPDAGVLITQNEGLRRYIDHKNTDLFGEQSGPGHELVGIPTGVFLQSLQFPSANDAAVTGIVWQRMTNDQLRTIQPGVIFPESVESDLTELYRRPIVEDGVHVGTVIGYSFKLTVREQFNFHRYPFDTKDVWLRMWPTDFDSNVVLVPDLRGYPEIAPARLPGLDSGFVLAGWESMRTYFQFRETSYSTNFGNREYVGATDFPELNFTLDVQRNFINTLVSDLIPLAVVTFLLFGVLRTISTEHDRLKLTGFTFNNVLGACSGLVFVILLGHIQLRNTLAGQEITYLEWYYFIIYIALVLTCINAWMIIVVSPPRILANDDNLAARVVFWPFITTAVCAATAFYFYPHDPKPTHSYVEAATVGATMAADVTPPQPP